MTDLTHDAETYISTLDESAHRTAAREYAAMQGDEFQARMGRAVDDIQTTLKHMEARLCRRRRWIPRWLQGALIAAGAAIATYLPLRTPWDGGP